VCRSCGAPLRHTFVDLGCSPLANSYPTRLELNRMEPFYPLHAYVCQQCYLVQLEEFESPSRIFDDYAYFASYSETWVEHAKTYCEMAIQRFQLGPQSRVIEIASNDGYLLQHFVKRDIPVLGIEPAANVATAAIGKGIPTCIEFFGEATARTLTAQGSDADLVVGNNVLAHVPGVNEFVQAIACVLRPNGVLTMEFPHLLCLIEQNQLDTIYHEHFSYFSAVAARMLFARHKLRIFDVEELPTHGGSLRIYVCHEGNVEPTRRSVADLLEREAAAGLMDLNRYLSFGVKAGEVRLGLLEFLIQAKRAGKAVVGYGAPAKGNTLLNYCGIRSDLLEYTVDRSPHKQGRYLPGTHIPIEHPDKIRETKPPYVLILPWNLKEEIMAQMSHIRTWGGQFVTPIPEVKVHS
jgi:SAM-dependent methyltransferase